VPVATLVSGEFNLPPDTDGETRQQMRVRLARRY